MDPGPTQIQLHYNNESVEFHLKQAEKVQQLFSNALVRLMAAQSQVLLDHQDILLDKTGLLVIESMCRIPTLEGDQTIRKTPILLSRY
jgi:hypothetical protein